MLGYSWYQALTISITDKDERNRHRMTLECQHQTCKHVFLHHALMFAYYKRVTSYKCTIIAHTVATYSAYSHVLCLRMPADGVLT